MDPAHTTAVLTAPVNAVMLRQRSVWNAFAWDLLDAQDRVRGEITLPWLAQARNARLRWHAPGTDAGDVGLVWDGRRLSIAHEYLNRRRLSDLRYTLCAGARTLATVELRYPPSLGRAQVEWLGPGGGMLVPQPGWWRRRLAIERDGRVRGWVEEPAALAVRKRIHIRVITPEPPEILALVAFTSRC